MIKQKIKNSLKRLKDVIQPNKTENLLIIEGITLAFLLYYDFAFNLPLVFNISMYLIVLLMIYISCFLIFYILERRKITEIGFQNRFYIFTQISFSFFFGIIFSAFYIALNNNELLSAIICTLPLSFLIIIGLFQRISSYQIEKFIKKFILKDNIWSRLDEQTRIDFKQADMSKGIERELKLAIFQPFKHAVEHLKNKNDLFTIIRPFKSDGSDPRQRTYQNFKNYLMGKRHLTFGNIPFYLLNLTDKKIGSHTELFYMFSEFLKEKLEDKFESVIEISKILFKHDFFTISGIKLSDLRNEAAHPQKKFNGNGALMPSRSSEILSVNNYITLIKVLAVKPNLLKLIIDLKEK